MKRRSFLNAMMAVPIGGSFSALNLGSTVALPSRAAQTEPTVLVSGLSSPRSVKVAKDGTVYFTEAGIGGDEELFEPGSNDGDEEPGSNTPFATRGASGKVGKVSPDGSVANVASGLTSYLIGGFEATGPAGLALGDDGEIYVSVGGPGPATGMIEPGEFDNCVVAIEENSGAISILADIGEYERTINPDPNSIDSNLYGLDLGQDGLLYVADAGGNAIYTVDTSSGRLELLTVIPGIALPEEMRQPGGNPARGGTQEIDPVPTGVAVAGDGSVYVSLLSGGPFPAGAASVQLIAGQEVTTFFGNLTMLTDVTIGPDGYLYAVQISTNFLVEPPAPGNVVRLLGDGTAELVVADLMLPNGIGFDEEGNLYVAAGTVTPPGSPPAGVILKVGGVAAN